MNRRIHRALACLGLVAVLAASCSDDDGRSTSSRDGDTLPGGEDTSSTTSTMVDFNTLPPVRVGEAADFGGNLFVTVTNVSAVDLQAQGPGSTAGPGIDVTVEIQNETGASADLFGIAVDATYGEGTPAVPVPVASGPPLRGQVEPGGRATGNYAFRLPADQISSVVIEVHNAGAPNVIVVEVD